MPTNAPTPEKPKCGIIMPISAIDGLSEAHWIEVNNILSDAIETAGFEANLVSSAEDVGIIQKTIIQNLYDNPVVVCDVSGKNPNVMFELGMRLAFDKPTIIVKDDKTSYSFDTSPIEHLNYPRDLRFAQIVDFKTKLADKVKNTHNKASGDPNYTTFLKNFGEFKIAKIDQKEVPGQEFIIEELRNLKQLVTRLDRSTRQPPPEEEGRRYLIDFRERPRVQLDAFLQELGARFPRYLPEVADGRVYIKAPPDISIRSLVAFERFVDSALSDKTTKPAGEISN